jgi:hypothetical protein
LYWNRGSIGIGTGASAGGGADLDDARLVSCGADGAVYTWSLRTGPSGSAAGLASSGSGKSPVKVARTEDTGAQMYAKRENEYIHKGVVFTSAIDIAGTTLAVASDRTLRSINDSLVTKEIRSSSADVNQIVISQSGRMMFVSTSFGTIKAVRCPIPADAMDLDSEELTQEHVAHYAPVTRLRITFDDRFLISGSEDGCICVFRIGDRDTVARQNNDQSASDKKQSEVEYSPDGKSKKPTGGGATDSFFADEVIVTKSDLEEKTAGINELRTRLEEIKIEHDYQLRLKDMHLQDKIKEVSTDLSKIIEGLKISSVVLRSEKDKEEAKHKDDIQTLVSRNQRELREMENKNNQQLMSEYEKFQALQDEMRRKQQDWELQYQQFEKDRSLETEAYTSRLEIVLQGKSEILKKLQEELDQHLREFTEYQNQQADDVETEVSLLESRYETQLKGEREVSFRYKGENGIMKKKFLTLNKEIEDNKIEITKLRDNENRLRKVMASLEKEVDGLKREMLERDKLIQEQEKRVYELKKNNQELEKFKFVLDHKIKDLKRQIEPREEQISQMKEKIVETNDNLSKQHQFEMRLHVNEEGLTKNLAAVNKELMIYHRRLHALQHLLKQCQMDVTITTGYIQDPPVLRKSVINIHQKYCANMSPPVPVKISDGNIELRRQEALLRKKIQKLKQFAQKQSVEFRISHFANVQENKALITEIKELQLQRGTFLPFLASLAAQANSIVCFGEIESLPLINLEKKYGLMESTSTLTALT